MMSDSLVCAVRRAACLLGLVALYACGGNGSGSAAPPAPQSSSQPNSAPPVISADPVSDSPQPAATAVQHKANYGHYFATHYSDTPAVAATLCEQPGVSGVVWRQTWSQVEPAPGSYDFSSFDNVLGAIAASRNPSCQLWLLVEFKSFVNSPIKNPCPAYLQARHSAPNSLGR